MQYFNDNYLKKTILVVEDDEISFLVISEFLKQQNYTILRAKNGKEAINVLKHNSHSVKVILMDILMPVMNGFESAKIIKKTNKNIIIIAQTAVDFKQQFNSNFSNFDNILLKPINFNNLKILVQSAFNKYNISKSLQVQMN